MFKKSLFTIIGSACVLSFSTQALVQVDDSHSDKFCVFPRMEIAQ
jgi:hypothetical protein